MERIFEPTILTAVWWSTGRVPSVCPFQQNDGLQERKRTSWSTNKHVSDHEDVWKITYQSVKILSAHSFTQPVGQV